MTLYTCSGDPSGSHSPFMIMGSSLLVEERFVVRWKGQDFYGHSLTQHRSSFIITYQ